MAIRLIALDLDGTALKDHRTLSERTRSAIVSALEAGFLVVPSTGRSYRDIPEAVRTLPGLPYFLTSNGAFLVEGGTERCVYSDLIPWEKAAEALRILETYEVQPSVHVGGASTNLKTADRRVVARYGNTDYFSRHSAENLSEYVSERRQGVEKIFAILFRPEQKAAIVDSMRAVYPFTVSASGADNIELNSEAASKGNALAALCRTIGALPEETAVIGDSINDSSMFRFAGCRIAMGNAEPCIKELSRYVTDTCGNDGAAAAIEKLIKGQWTA